LTLDPPARAATQGDPPLKGVSAVYSPNLEKVGDAGERIVMRYERERLIISAATIWLIAFDGWTKARVRRVGHQLV